MFHVKHQRKIIHKYEQAKIDYSILAISIYKNLKEEKNNENEVTTIENSELHGLQGA